VEYAFKVSGHVVFLFGVDVMRGPPMGGPAFG
jgi:hypothetical protein